MSVFFTSDHHFGHANIIKYTNRPFENVREMNQVLTEAWNKKVSPEDTVYHLGDFTLNKEAHKYLRLLNGKIFFLRLENHHDHRWLKKFKEEEFPKVKFLHRIETLCINKQYIAISHYPFAQWDRKHHGSWHLHGHSHGAYKGPGLILDVGVDNSPDYSPFSFEEVKEIMESKNV